MVVAKKKTRKKPVEKIPVIDTDKPASLALVLKALEEKKAEDIRIFNVKHVVGYADYFVFCSGTSAPHLEALTEAVARQLKPLHTVRKSGDSKSGWIVLDCGELVVHCFGVAERAFYNLEELWHDADVTYHHY